MVKDPVCGMNVDEKTATAVTYEGKIYYFCSYGCKANFQKDQTKYVRELGAT